MPAYYSDLEFENFHIANRVESVLKESQDILKKSAGLKKEVENYDRRNLTRSLVILIGICILIAIVRYSFSKRKVFYSLITSLIFLCLAGYCCVLNGTPISRRLPVQLYDRKDRDVPTVH